MAETQRGSVHESPTGVAGPALMATVEERAMCEGDD
jgi:hypothetical protein